MDKSFDEVISEDFLEHIKHYRTTGNKNINRTKNFLKKLQIAEQATSKDSHSFLERLLTVLDKWRTAVFGINHYVTSTKTINRNTANEFLVDALFSMEKYLSKTSFVNEQLDWYDFLKLILEKDVPLFEDEAYL